MTNSLEKPGQAGTEGSLAVRGIVGEGVDDRDDRLGHFFQGLANRLASDQGGFAKRYIQGLGFIELDIDADVIFEETGPTVHDRKGDAGEEKIIAPTNGSNVGYEGSVERRDDGAMFVRDIQVMQGADYSPVASVVRFDLGEALNRIETSLSDRLGERIVITVLIYAGGEIDAVEAGFLKQHKVGREMVQRAPQIVDDIANDKRQCFGRWLDLLYNELLRCIGGIGVNDSSIWIRGEEFRDGRFKLLRMNFRSFDLQV